MKNFLKFAKFFITLILIKSITAYNNTIKNVKNINDLEIGVNCLSNFLSYSFEKTRPITLLTPKNVIGKSSIENELITKNLLSSNLPVYAISGNNLDPIGYYSRSKYAIILIDKPSVLKDYDSDLLYICAFKCQLFVVVLSQRYSNKASFLADVSYLKHILWERKINNFVITGLITSEFLFAKSIKYRFNETCYPMEPLIIGSSCTSKTDYENLTSKIFKEMDFNNCIMKATVVHRPPYGIISKNNPFGGTNVLILNKIADHFNFQLQYTGLITSGVRNLSEFVTPIYKRDHQFFIIGGWFDGPVGIIDFLVAYDVS